MANNSKQFGFTAYQTDFSFLKDTGKKEVYANEWNSEIMIELFEHIINMDSQKKKKTVKDEWFMIVDDFKYNDNFIYGKFKSAEYGVVNKLVNADTLKSRKNPKNSREGEERFTHFLIRRKDGFTLLQTTDRRLSRSRIESYLSDLGKPILIKHQYIDLEVSSLLSEDFIKDISNLDKIESTVIEVNAKEKSDENEFVEALQSQIDSIEGTHVMLTYKARYKKEGLQGMIPFINKFRGKKGVTSIRVVGEKSGATQTFNVDKYRENYKPKIKIDANKNPISVDLYDKLILIAERRDDLRRGD